MGEKEVQILRSLFSHPDCHISNLEMEELEVPDDKSGSVIDAVS